MAKAYSNAESQTGPEGDMGKETEQAKILRAAREKLGTTSEELSELLGVSLPTLRNWLVPTSSKTHRRMPQTAKILLGYVLKYHPTRGTRSKK